MVCVGVLFSFPRAPQVDSPKPHSFSNGTVKGAAHNPGVDVTPDLSDDDLSEEIDGASEAGPFGSLQELRNNPGEGVACVRV